MKFLSLKYKMHKLVNLIFYSIIFGIGFLLGFGAEKINVNKIIGQILFIDNVSAQTVTTCRDSVNLFNKNLNIIDNMTMDSYGNIIDYSGVFIQEYYIPVKALTSYTLSTTELVSDSWLLVIIEYDKNHDLLIRNIERTNNFLTITTSKDTSFLRVSASINIIDTLQLEKGNKVTSFEPFGEKFCTTFENDSFYEFAQNIFGEVSEENQFIYDFITLALVGICYILFVLIVGYIFKKFFGG